VTNGGPKLTVITPSSVVSLLIPTIHRRILADPLLLLMSIQANIFARRRVSTVGLVQSAVSFRII